MHFYTCNNNLRVTIRVIFLVSLDTWRLSESATNSHVSLVGDTHTFLMSNLSTYIWTCSVLNKSTGKQITKQKCPDNSRCLRYSLLSCMHPLHLHKMLTSMCWNRANLKLKPGTLKTSLLCRVSEMGFLRRTFKPSTDFIQFLFSEHSVS
jgi:hypothetical protein